MAKGQKSPKGVERREPTSVPHLDDIVGGGLPRGALVLVMGVPGSGKTTLASQIAFAWAHAGKKVLMLTALSESTMKLLAHLQTFAFYDDALLGGPLQLFSIESILAQGLKATGNAIIAEARRLKVDLVMLDGFRGMRSVDAEPQAAREFLYDLGTTLGAFGITTILTSETDPRDPAFFPETTTADIILGLHYTLTGVRQYRGIEVIKARGSLPLPGLHALILTAEGASVYPQLEERVARAFFTTEAQGQGAVSKTTAIRPSALPLQRMAFDLPAFDAMLAGGIPQATSTLLAGSLGTGKTLLSLYFALAGVRAGEQVVFVGFRENKAQLQQVAESFTLTSALRQAFSPQGGLTFLEVPPIKVNPDVLADHILNEIDRLGAQRLIIDSIAEIERGVIRSGDPQRLEDYLAALLLALRERHVTSLFLKESDKALAATLDFSADALSVLAENVLLLQQVPYRGHLHRILSIIKLRFSDHDSALREFQIRAPEGLQVLAPFESASGVLAGITEDQEQQQTGRRRERTED